MPDISIFAKPAKKAKIDGHLLRGSSIIRGEQVAGKIGAKLNPTEGYENDICIFVKPNTRWLYLEQPKLPQNTYFDVIDSDPVVMYARKHPEIGVITCSLVDYQRLKNKTRCKVEYIPQQHCNFERAKRSKTQITTVGVIGAPGLIGRLPESLEKNLNQSGFNLFAYSGFHNRMDVVNFYKQIDVQLVWRPWPARLSNPLKVVNAASFGIPTISYPEPAMDEVKECVLPTLSVDEIIQQTLILKNSPDKYSEYAERCLQKAEEYHIDNIAKYYYILERGTV